MTDDLEQRRKAYDRRQRAWVCLVFGVLIVWAPGLGLLGQESTGLKLLGTVFVGLGSALVIAALVLFQRPRP